MRDTVEMRTNRIKCAWGDRDEKTEAMPLPEHAATHGLKMLMGKVGQHYPVFVDKAGRVVFGHYGFLALRAIGAEKVEAMVVESYKDVVDYFRVRNKLGDA